MYFDAIQTRLLHHHGMPRTTSSALLRKHKTQVEAWQRRGVPVDQAARSLFDHCVLWHSRSAANPTHHHRGVPVTIETKSDPSSARGTRWVAWAFRSNGQRLFAGSSTTSEADALRKAMRFLDHYDDRLGAQENPLPGYGVLVLGAMVSVSVGTYFLIQALQTRVPSLQPSPPPVPSFPEPPSLQT